MESRLSMERLPRRGVRAMDIFVARHAAATHDPDATGLYLSVVINRRGMVRSDVAPLAEHRHLCDQQPLVRRPVWIVARHAALTTGRMLEQDRPALLGVAADARLVDIAACAEQL